MHKILIFWNAWSGKSTLANRLADRLNIPAYHIDDLAHDDRLERLPHGVIESRLREIIARDEWILDGDYRGQVLEERLDAADMIFWLDTLTIVSLYRIIRRFVRCELGLDDRIGLRPGQKNRLSLKFLYWVIWKYPHSSKRKMLEVAMNRCPKKIRFLRSFREIDRMIAELA